MLSSSVVLHFQNDMSDQIDIHHICQVEAFQNYFVQLIEERIYVVLLSAPLRIIIAVSRYASVENRSGNIEQATTYVVLFKITTTVL